MQNSNSPQIIAIRARYKASLPEKAAMIDEQLQILEGPDFTLEQITETHEMLHKLAGSAGMYGYDDISALCRSGMTTASAKNMDLLLSQLQELKDLLDQHA